MIAVQLLSIKNRSLFCRLMVCLSAIVLFSSVALASSGKNSTALSLLAEASRVNSTPQVNYRLSVNPKGIVATPALTETPSVSISGDFPVNHRVKINNEEHFVTISPSSTDNSVTVETKAADGVSAHRYRIYPNKTLNEGHSFYIKDESSGTTFFAATNDRVTNLSIKQIGNNTTEGKEDDGGRFGGLSNGEVLAIIMGTALVVIVILVVIVCKCCSGGGTSPSFHINYDAGGGCEA